MPPKLLIGLTGKAGAGKDTFANFFPDCERLAFAKPLKDAAHHLFNFTEKQLYDPDEKEKVDPMWGKSPRQLLQILETELLREQLDKDIFIKNMEQRIQSSTADILFITDARFDNEV
jgi:predicted kinase